MTRQPDGIVALQRCDQFVGRTLNWLYDHLRFVPRYRLLVLCDMLLNRQEFPYLEARVVNQQSLGRRLWRRAAGDLIYPIDHLRLLRAMPRLLHSHFGYVAAEDVPIVRSLDVPWVVSFYGADVYQLRHRPEWRDTYATVFSRATKVLVLGPVMADALKAMGCPPDKVVVHPLGVDVDGLPPAPRILRPGSPIKLLFAGTFREKKGIRYVVEAAAQARRRGVRLELHLAGGATDKPGDRETEVDVERLINELALADVVTRHGFLRFDELVALALRSHVFLAPSVTAMDGDAEGTPFVLQQMMATGMPAIATRHSDVPFLFGDAGDMLVPERDSMAIADRIERHAKDPSALVTDGERLRWQVREHFNARRLAVKLAQLYDGLRA